MRQGSLHVGIPGRISLEERVAVAAHVGDGFGRRILPAHEEDSAVDALH